MRTFFLLLTLIALAGCDATGFFGLKDNPGCFVPLAIR